MTDVATTPLALRSPDRALPGRDAAARPGRGGRTPARPPGHRPTARSSTAARWSGSSTGSARACVWSTGWRRRAGPAGHRPAVPRRPRAGPPTSGPPRRSPRPDHSGRSSHDADLGAVWWSFPRDRKLGDLGWLTAPDESLAQRDAAARVAADGGGPVRPRALAHRPCARRRGGDPRLRQGLRPAAPCRRSVLARRHHQVARELRRTPDPVSAPDSLAWSNDRGLLLMEAMPGQRWNTLAGDRLARAMGDLGVAVAPAARQPPHSTGCPAFGRLRTDRVAHCAEHRRPGPARRGRSTPSVWPRRLRRRDPAPGTRRGPARRLPPRQRAPRRGRVALIDLDQMGRGPAAADLGSLLARLRYAATIGDLDAAEAHELEARFLAGYAERRAAPGRVVAGVAHGRRAGRRACAARRQPGQQGRDWPAWTSSWRPPTRPSTEECSSESCRACCSTASTRSGSATSLGRSRSPTRSPAPST